MREPLVVQLMRQFKQALLLREAAEMQTMAARWLEIERAVEAQISLIARELATEQAAGQVVSQGRLYQMERYQSLLGQMRREIEGYTMWAERAIAGGQEEYARLGIEHARQAIAVSYSGGVVPYFAVLPVSATQNMVGLLGDGTPLRRLLEQSWPDAADAMTRALIKGTALGWNPTRTAAAMRDGMAQGLDRALTIARTEQMRAYRESSRMQYEESGVVRGYRRIAAHDTNTCIACLVTEGEWYETRESLRDHPRGRCSTIPAVKGMPSPSWQMGKAWFRQQPAEVQQKMMGRDYYRAWKRREFKLDELATVKRDTTWGDSVQVRPLRELRKSAETAA